MRKIKDKTEETGVTIYETSHLRVDLNAIYMHHDRYILLRGQPRPLHEALSTGPRTRSPMLRG